MGVVGWEVGDVGVMCVVMEIDEGCTAGGMPVMIRVGREVDDGCRAGLHDICATRQERVRERGGREADDGCAAR